ncbi:autoinducer-2 ABC transporter permease LsrD [Klebsiella pneumoniae]|nr:autoinducer-2 ABC transporter permease LsrD [Klebsiella pneumoniae]
MKLKLKLNWESALLALLIVEILLFGALNPRMLDLNMLLFSTSDFICIGIVALPLTLVIISGGIDISLGSTIGLCAIALGVMTQAGWPLWLAVSLTLLLGLLCGLFNAALIHYTGISPLVITLGTLYLYGGGALLLSGMAGATGYEGIGGFPDSFTAFANLTLAGLPLPLVLFAIITFFFWLLTHRGRFGRHLFLLGQNPRAARYAALSVNGIPYVLYGLVGVASAVAALVMVSYFGSARSDLGRDLLDAGADRGGARRGQYLRRLGIDTGYRAGGIAGGVSATGFTDGRHPQPGVERAVRGAVGCGGDGAFAEPAP